jgi:hypothetical protein
MTKMTDKEIENLKLLYESRGFICDLDNETTFGFKWLEDEEHEWCIDYNKSTGRFISLNGKQKINVKKA